MLHRRGILFTVMVLGASSCFLGGQPTKPEPLVSPAVRPPPPEDRGRARRAALPPNLAEDRDRDVGLRPVPPLGPADTAVPSADPEALKEAERMNAETSSAAGESSIVVGVALLRPRSGALVEGTAIVDEQRGGTRFVLELDWAPIGTYRVEMMNAPMVCDRAVSILESEPAPRSAVISLGSLGVKSSGTARFVSAIPRARGANLYALVGRAVIVRGTAGPKKSLVLACGTIALSKNAPFGANDGARGIYAINAP
jgi:hypothetical protein